MERIWRVSMKISLVQHESERFVEAGLQVRRIVLHSRSLYGEHFVLSGEQIVLHGEHIVLYVEHIVVSGEHICALWRCESTLGSEGLAWKSLSPWQTRLRGG